jgi:biopolymer transport protein ExbB/TolQ
MEEILNKITLLELQNDSTLLLMVGLGVVVMLTIVLTIVVSAMRVKTHRERFLEVLTDNKAKAESLISLGQELQDLKIKDAKCEQELIQFEDTKKTFAEHKERHRVLQESSNDVGKELSEYKAKLEATEGMFENLTVEYKVLKERHETLQEENVKCRTNNARLLMKLENT